MRPARHLVSILALTLAIAVATAPAALAVAIYFKDGSAPVMADGYRVEGDKLIATLQSGQEIALPLAEVDLEQTEEMGKIAKGSAIVIDRAEASEMPERERTLADVLRERPAAPPLSSAAERASESRTVRRTPAGNLDFFTLPRSPITGERGQEILALLRAQGLREPDLYQGTGSDRVLVDLVTASRSEVFSALEKCAGAFLEIRKRFPEIAALELVMATATRSRAGQFVLTPADAERLARGEVTPADHFVANVLF